MQSSGMHSIEWYALVQLSRVQHCFETLQHTATHSIALECNGVLCTRTPPTALFRVCYYTRCIRVLYPRVCYYTCFECVNTLIHSSVLLHSMYSSGIPSSVLFHMFRMCNTQCKRVAYTRLCVITHLSSVCRALLVVCRALLVV